MKKWVLNIIFTLFLILILFIASIPLSTSNNFSSTDDVLIYAIPYNFDEYSFYTADSYSTKQWNSAVYATLLKQLSANNLEWEGYLAVDLPIMSTNQKTFTFQLRDNLKFSNGHDLTAQDVEFSFKVALTSSINLISYTNYIGFLDNNSVKLINSNEIEFTLSSLHNSPYTLLNFPIIDQEEFVERYDQCLEGVTEDCLWNNPNGDDVISAGPFMISDIDSVHDIVTVVANPFYYRTTEIYADKLIFQKIADKNAANSALAADLIDIMDQHYNSDLQWRFSENIEGIDIPMLSLAIQNWDFVRLEGFLQNGLTKGSVSNNENFIGALLVIWFAVVIFVLRRKGRFYRDY